MTVGFVFRRKKFLPSFLLSGPTNINRIYTFPDVPVDTCGYASMCIFYYFSYQSTLLLSSLSDLRSHVLSPFVRSTGDHFGVDNKVNRNHFGVDLGITVQGWASFRVPNYFGSCKGPIGFSTILGLQRRPSGTRLTVWVLVSTSCFPRKAGRLKIQALTYGILMRNLIDEKELIV